MTQWVRHDRRGFSPSPGRSFDGSGIVIADRVWLSSTRRFGTITCAVGCSVCLVRGCDWAGAIGAPDPAALSLAMMVVTETDE